MKIETIKKRLNSLGYIKISTDDEWILTDFLMPKVKNHILNNTNQTSIPKGLQKLACDRVCGEFLLAKKNSGQFAIDSSKVAKEFESITEGKFTLKYSSNNKSQSNDSKLDALIDYLIHGNEEELLCYRKIKW